MKDFSIDYYILVTVASMGVLQLAASRSGLKGLLVFRSPLVTRIVGAILPLASVIWFFGGEDRNISDHLGGLSSNEVALTFFVGVLTAWVVTVTVSSAVNARMHRGAATTALGIDALRDTTYYRALPLNLRLRSKIWRAQTKRYFSG